MQSMLAKLGYERYDLASSGQHAVELIEEARRAAQHYDAVLLDIRLPLLSGLQVADRVCALYPSKRERPFLIAVTASVLEADKDTCREHGMNGYIAKPINMRELDTMLQLIAERRRQHATPPTLIL
jgi:CheY-like chemotaxis protein